MYCITHIFFISIPPDLNEIPVSHYPTQFPLAYMLSVLALNMNFHLQMRITMNVRLDNIAGRIAEGNTQTQHHTIETIHNTQTQH